MGAQNAMRWMSMSAKSSCVKLLLRIGVPPTSMTSCRRAAREAGHVTVQSRECGRDTRTCPALK